MGQFSTYCASLLMGILVLADLSAADSSQHGALRNLKDSRIVNQDNLVNHLQDTFSNARSFAQPEEWERVRQEIISYFNDLMDSDDGMPTDALNVHEFPIDIGNDMVTAKNIALTMLGSGAAEKRKVVVIGSHYNSQPTSPAVDDNGSGMAALLEIARLLFLARKDCPFQNTVVLVAFDIGDFDADGSQAWVEEYLVPNVLIAQGIHTDNFYGAFIMDSLMNWDEELNAQAVPFGFNYYFPELERKIVDNEYRGDFLALFGRRDDGPLVDILHKWWENVTGGTTSGVKHKLLGEATEYLIGIPSDSLQEVLADMLRSDHSNFWTYNSSTYGLNTGLKAAYLTDTGSFRGYMADCQFTECDSIDQITAEPERVSFLSTIAEVVLRASLSVATDLDDLSCFQESNSVQLAPGHIIVLSLTTLLLLMMGL